VQLRAAPPPRLQRYAARLAAPPSPFLVVVRGGWLLARQQQVNAVGGFQASRPVSRIGLSVLPLLVRAPSLVSGRPVRPSQRVQHQRCRMASSTPFRDAVSGGVGSVFCVYAGIPFDTVRRRRCQCTDSVRILTLVCVSAHAVAR
jgi:hypothetical protein